MECERGANIGAQESISRLQREDRTIEKLENDCKVV